MASGLKVLEAMLEEDRAAVCGPRYAHQAARQAYRATRGCLARVGKVSVVSDFTFSTRRVEKNLYVITPWCQVCHVASSCRLVRQSAMPTARSG